MPIVEMKIWEQGLPTAEENADTQPRGAYLVYKSRGSGKPSTMNDPLDKIRGSVNYFILFLPILSEREGDPKRWSTVPVTALGSYGTLRQGNPC
jgi:hypothetical protein